METMINGIQFDKESTSAYRDVYNDPCDCDACKIFRNTFRKQYPDVVAYLTQFGVDVDYPLTVMDFSDREEEYPYKFTVYYSVKGTLPIDKMENKIGGVSVTLRNWNIADEEYANTGMTKPYFIIALDEVII